MPKKDAADAVMSVDQFLKEIDSISHAHRRYENFMNFVEAAYCALAKKTAPDGQRAEELESRYMSVVAKYEECKTEAMLRMSILLGRLTMTLNEYEGDFLGSAYMLAGLGDQHLQQFFTPYPIALMMVKMTLDAESVHRAVSEQRPFTLMEPTAGSGVMVIAAAQIVRSLGYEPAKVMLATLVDKDRCCMQMAFLQMWILNIPAICVHGDSLAMTEHERAVTAAALMQRWTAHAAIAEGTSDGHESSEMEANNASLPEQRERGAPVTAITPVPDPEPDDPGPVRSHRVQIEEQGDLF